MTPEQQEKYRACITETMAGAGGMHAVTVLYAYLNQLEAVYGEQFNPFRALHGIIDAAQMLQGELIKAKLLD